MRKVSFTNKGYEQILQEQIAQEQISQDAIRTFPGELPPPEFRNFDEHFEDEFPSAHDRAVGHATSSSKTLSDLRDFSRECDLRDVSLDEIPGSIPRSASPDLNMTNMSGSSDEPLMGSPNLNIDSPNLSPNLNTTTDSNGSDGPLMASPVLGVTNGITTHVTTASEEPLQEVQFQFDIEDAGPLSPDVSPDREFEQDDDKFEEKFEEKEQEVIQDVTHAQEDEGKISSKSEVKFTSSSGSKSAMKKCDDQPATSSFSTSSKTKSVTKSVSKGVTFSDGCVPGQSSPLPRPIRSCLKNSRTDFKFDERNLNRQQPKPNFVKKLNFQFNESTFLKKPDGNYAQSSSDSEDEITVSVSVSIVSEDVMKGFQLP